MTGNKNVRLSFDAWQALRKLKFTEQIPTYTDVFVLLFNRAKGLEMDTHPKTKSPGDVDGAPTNQSDKTIVINDEMHRKLTEFKIEYMLKSGATARGKNAVSISDVVLELIKNYQTMQ